MHIIHPKLPLGKPGVPGRQYIRSNASVADGAAATRHRQAARRRGARVLAAPVGAFLAALAAVAVKHAVKRRGTVPRAAKLFSCPVLTHRRRVDAWVSRGKERKKM